ncbi:hypothetical protein V5799_004982 [Amblyomma americanum]|uniref:Uncharacterized protein n=1 Tax=Amblyomma americanum TaxID=6943 RepID=A0AAQ4D4J8_AMBAM
MCVYGRPPVTIIIKAYFLVITALLSCPTGNTKIARVRPYTPALTVLRDEGKTEGRTPALCSGDVFSPSRLVFVSKH